MVLCLPTATLRPLLCNPHQPTHHRSVDTTVKPRVALLCLPLAGDPRTLALLPVVPMTRTAQGAEPVLGSRLAVLLRCDRRPLLAGHAEDQTVVVLHAQTAGAGCCPLRLIRMHVDAGPVLVVVPAAGKSLAAGAHANVTSACLAGHHLTGAYHAAITPALLLLHHRHLGRAVVLASWHRGRAGSANTLVEEAGILAGAGHAELHGAMVGPLLLLERHPVANGVLVLCCVTESLCLLPVSALAGRLAGVVEHVLQEDNVSPRVAATVLHPVDAGRGNLWAVPDNVHRPALATRDPASWRLCLHEPGAMLALPGHHIATVAKEVSALSKAHLRATLAAGTILKLIH